MNNFSKTIVLALAPMLGWSFSATAADTNPTAVSEMLNRIGGAGTADRFVTVVDEDLNTSAEQFVITSEGGKPCIKGTTLSAVTTGINWYLNHYAHVNLTWNRPTTDLSTVSLPVPTAEETHSSAAPYRYYLNYCTYSYSMSTWTWERWQQEIDWMALHGINMPLQIVGLDVVWRNLLTKDYGYTTDEANDFIAGPCFQAWFGMNNLEGWGGPNPDWWYTRQEQLCKQINSRMRELGIEPVLPGYAGMVPSNFQTKTGIAALAQGNWCGFTRPYILDPTTDGFAAVAEKYYARLKEVMGESQYYSIDPFHEGADISSISDKINEAYKAIYTAMNAAKPNSQWVIQQWQWAYYQYYVLDNVPQGQLIVLDLFADGSPNWGSYKGHDVVYSTISNFGGRTGLMGRFNGVIDGYFTARNSGKNVTGIGASPEAIEQVPVLYDMLYELPWYASKPDAQAWMADYAQNRYGVTNEKAAEAWELLRNSALNCTSSLQGPHEAVMCARPAWTVNAVSSWGGTTIFYDPDDVIKAAYAFLDANLSGDNYSYDLTDISRQALTDYSYYLLKAINSVRTSDPEKFAARKASFLALMSDLDRLLGTNSNFRLGKWTTLARGIADEVSGTTDSDKNWLELDNARTLITTWGARSNSESAGLRDYSYRQWNGMLSDFYRPRWEKFFAGQSVNWFDNDHAWATDATLSYSMEAEGDTRTIAQELLGKYIMRITLPDGTTDFAYASMTTDLSATTFVAYRGEAFTSPVALANPADATLSIDWNGDGEFSADEQTTDLTNYALSATASLGDYAARITLTDGTEVKFTLSIRDHVTSERTITVTTTDASQGSVAITGVEGDNVTTLDPVTITATPAAGYRFSYWRANGDRLSTANPYTYYGAADIQISAVFDVVPTVKCGDWTLTYNDLSDGNIAITGVEVAGSGALDLSQVEGGKTVTALTFDAFKGNTSLISINFPASLTSLGDLFTYSLEGAQAVSVMDLEAPIEQGTSFSLKIRVANDGTSYNQWGSGLMATGEEPLGVSYDGGFQLYLKAAQTIIIKTNSSETAMSTTVGSDFTFELKYDATAKTLTCTLHPESGADEVKTITDYTLNTISKLSFALPTGVDIESLRIFDSSNQGSPFSGCTSLTNITVSEGNPEYSAKDGMLYNANATELLAFPEGKLFNGAVRLLNSGQYLYADPIGGATGVMGYNGRQVLATDSPVSEGCTLWNLVSISKSDYFKVQHLNSERFFGGYSSTANVELPVSATQYHGEYSYDITYSADKCYLTLQTSDGYYLTFRDGQCMGLTQPDAVGSAQKFEIIVPKQFTVADWSTLALPVAVKVEDTNSDIATAYFVNGLNSDGSKVNLTSQAGKVIAPATGFIAGPGAVISYCFDGSATSTDSNLLTPAMINLSGLSAGNFYTLQGEAMTLSTATTAERNTAYLSKSALPSNAQSSLQLSGNASLDVVTDILNVRADGNAELYDLLGRKVGAQPRAGIYVAPGQKLVIKK